MGRLSSLPSALVTDDSALGGLVVERGLRFDDGDSAYLSRTPSSAGNRKTFTYSCWFKRGNLGTQSGAFLKAGSASSNYFKINIANDHKLYVLATIGGSYTEYLRSERLFRDTSAWMHLVLRWDTTNSTAADRVIVYINGSRISTSAYNAPTQDLDGFVNDTNLHEIGASTVNSQYWDGYIAEVNFVDGFSLDPSNFGYTDFQTKTWRPKGYFGSYGTNGFRLPFTHRNSFKDFVDESSSKHFIIPNGDVIHTSDQKKNGATSLYFDDTSDTLRTSDSSDFTFGTNDFTIEAYVRRTRQGDDEWFFIQSDGTSANTSIGLHFWSSSYGDVNKPTMRMRIGGSNYDTNGTTVTVANTWYHIAGVRQGNTFRIYVNGVQEGTTTNSGAIHDPTTPFVIGAVNSGGSAGLKGYMDQIRISNVCRYPDGTSFTPPTSQFTPDSNTKLLVQSNVLHHLGTDVSGQGNDFTPNGLVGSDSVLDTPSNNFATVKTLGTPAVTTMAEGNLYLDTNATGNARANRSTGMSTYFVNSGKWYCEHYHLGINTMVGVAPPQIMRPYTSDNTRYVMVYSGGGNKYVNTNGSESNSTYATNYYVGGTTGILIDMDQTTPVMYVSYNGQWANGSGAWNQSNPYTSGGAIPMGDSFFTNNIDSTLSGSNGRKGYCGFWSANAGGGEARHIYNFGQDSTFAGSTTSGGYKDSAGIGDFKYPVPDGALALCSNNLSRLDNERNTTSLIDPKKHFGVVTWSGNNSTSNRKISGLEFQPDLVWTKTRNHTYHHVWFDSNRGPSNRINSDENFLENHTNGGYLASFDHDGFTWQYGGGSSNAWWNESGKNYVAWCWKAGGTPVANNDGDVTTQVSFNEEAGFSIVKFTTPASGDAYSIGHGLGKIPELIIMKNRSVNNNWDIYHHGNGDSPEYRRLRINTNDARQGVSAWNDFVPTSTIFKSRTSGNWYNSNSNVIAYCWYSIPGYSAFGCYEGNGQSDGPYVYTGFRPALIIIKSYSNGGNSYTWFMCDSTTGPRNNIYQRLEPNTSNSQVTDASNPATVDFYSDGFKLRGTGSMLNGNTVEYVYMAWAEQSTNTPYASEPNAR